MQKQSQWGIKNLLMLLFLVGAEKELFALHFAGFVTLNQSDNMAFWDSFWDQ